VLELGRVGGAVALLQARRALVEGRFPRCIVAGVDSYLTEATLSAYGQDDRLLTRSNSNGFIPGEAAAAIMLGRAGEHPNAALTLHGLGFAREPAPFGSGRPLRADGLVEAISGALA
jgi:3-oxoacyl-[acyl-carrier-protein] synthase-1